LSEWFGVERRAKAVGLLLGGLSIGTLVTPPLVAWLSLELGWRAAFVVTGAAGLALAGPWWWLHRGTEAESRRQEESIPLGEMLRRRQYWCILGARAMTDGAWYFYLFWLPGYFQEIRRFDLAMVGQWLWIPYASAYAGALAGGWASSALLRGGWTVNRARKGVLGPSAVLAGLGGLAYLAPGPFAALAVVSLALFGHLSWATNIHTVITEIAPGRHLAVLYGITGAAGTLLGALTQPVIGMVVDRSGHGPVFVGAGAAYAVALVLLGLGGRIGGRPIQ
jgi:ACS family hexuronate transporter-like MFS transporter